MALSALLFAFIILSSTAPHSVASFDSSMPAFPSPVLSIDPPMNGEAYCETIDDKKTCTATCKFGYRFDKPDATDGEQLVNELVDGLWSLGPKFPDCKLVTCEATAPENGKVTCEPNGDFTLCSVECDEGYRTSHTHLYMCDLNTGVWAPALPETDSFGQCLSGKDHCLNMDAPENGYIICDHIDGEHRCTPSCRSGYALTSAPDDGYFTCQSGAWSPVDLAVCSPTSDIVDPIGLSAVTGIYTNTDVPVEQTGYCMTWGQHHYRTFDGKIYRFQGECSYTLVEDKEHFFSVILNNAKNCVFGGQCSRTLTIYVSDLEIELKGDARDQMPGAFVDGQSLALPTSISGVLVQRVADFIVVRDPESDFYVKWDGLESIFIRVGEANIGNTEGLCGLYDRNADNDFTKSGGQTIAAHVEEFAKSWVFGTCDSTTTHTYCSKATDSDQRILAKALQSCQYLMDTQCKYVVNPEPYFEACKEDVCWSENDDSVCSSMAAYFRECSRLGVIVDWRAQDRCMIDCPGKLTYDVCGTSCPKTCFDTSYNCENDHCIEGCHCPEGTYLHNGTCVTQYQCPCQFGRDEFAPGSRIRRDCNRCVCARGRWVCTKNICDAVCKSVGNHFTTFDGKDFDFDGVCSYTLAKSDGVQEIAFEVVLVNTVTSDKHDRSLKVTVNNEEIVIFPDGRVEIEAKEAILPVHSYFYAMERVTTSFFKVTINNGLTVLFDGTDRVYIRAKSDLSGRMRGMCGNFNQQTKDDFWTKNGDIATNAHDFGDEWVTGSCSSPDTEPNYQSPCETHKFFRPNARESCEVLTAAPFTKCHDVVNYKLFFTQCMDDVCAAKDIKLQCRALADYSMACSKSGVVLGDWREVVTECADEITCPEGTIFKECANACGSSCGSLQSSTICDEQCVPGCTCPEGQVFDYGDNCVEVAQCSCMFENVIYEAGESRMQDCNVCECHHGKWACTDNLCPVNTQCQDNEEFTSCMKIDIVTCSNMHLPHINRKISNCIAGCQCVSGYVWDVSTSTCVKPTTCPCYHGGRSYSEDETMQQDCNTCRCLAGFWDCELNECAGMCRAYGDSHYTTFDGKSYQFVGANTFTMVRSTVDSSHKFQVSIENVGCGSTGGTCSKRVIFSINMGDPATENNVELVKGKPAAEKKVGSFDISYVGLWVFVTAKDMGVTLQWDKGTSVMVRVDPEYKTNVEGLCGDFDDSQINDFKTPQGIVEPNHIPFVNSWKTNTDGNDAEDVPTDMCGVNSHRKYWAERKCAAITGSLFKPCHSLVEPRTYYDACVYDACACDSGGDCECLCTAIHAYAQECNRNGVHIYWRSNSLCPLMCYGKEREYSPCMSACPKTCDNFNDYDKIRNNCPLSPVEGCSCEDGMVASPDGEVCMPVEECVCKEIDGVTYVDGEKIEHMSDECRSCYCINHDISCLGLPCDEGGLIPPISTCIGEYGASAEYGGFQFKPAELTPALCSDLYDNLVNTCGKENMIECSFRCNQVCHAWKIATSQCTHATSDDQCVDTCGEECVSCPLNYVLKDPQTCVRPSDCVCMLPDGSTLGPGQVKNDRQACLRYYCWNNELTDELIPGCKQSLGDSLSDGFGDGSAPFGNELSNLMGFSDGLGSGVGVASKSSKGSPTIMIPGRKLGSKGQKYAYPTEDGMIPSDGVGDLPGVSDGLPSDKYDMITEDNGVITKHLPHTASDSYADASAAFTGLAGYSDMEWPVVMRNGPIALGSDAGMFHDAQDVADTLGDKFPGSDGILGDGTSGTDGLPDNSMGKYPDDMGDQDGGYPSIDQYDVVDEKPICIDESGFERCYGDSWVYSSDSCKTCSCVGAASVTCHERECDPYPDCPSGYFVVEEKADACCMSYRIVEESCDVSQCTDSPKLCGVNEILISYPIDNCCATYECQCNMASCFKLSNVPCPKGSIRKVIDPTECCGVGKCVSTSSSAFASAGVSGTGLMLMLPGDGYGPSENYRVPDMLGGPNTGVPSTDNIDQPMGLIPHIADEACLCIDASGVERKFGEQWFEYASSCQLCTCSDKDSISCSPQICDPYPSEEVGMKIVEEKTSECCSTYRLVPDDCDTSSCQFQPIQCSPCERLITYKIDDCCSTYECSCEEANCASLGNPSCPPGAVRVVIDQDTCCPVPKCTFMDKNEAAAAARVLSAHSQSSIFGLPRGASDGYPSDGFTDKPGSDGIPSSPSDDSGIDTGKPSDSFYPQTGGDTYVTPYLPGKTNIGSSALADLANNGGLMGGFFGPQFGGYPMGTGAGTGAGSSAGSSSPIIHMLGKNMPSPFGKGGSPYGMGDDGMSPSGDQPITPTDGSFPSGGSGLQVAPEAAICTDSVGTERCYGEQWNDAKDACSFCTCTGVGTIECKTESCDPIPVVEDGFKLVSESSDRCCMTYRVVPQSCDVTECQMEAPSCKICEKMITYELDECCATYECVCNSEMCAEMSDVPCGSGFERMVIEPEACCPVGKCVSTSGSGFSYSSSGLNLQLDGVPTSGFGDGLVPGKDNFPGDDSSGMPGSSPSGIPGDMNPDGAEQICIDENGRSRCYGETWYKSGDACHVCSCTNVNTVDCESVTCESYPSVPEGHQVIEEKSDDCCYSYKIVPEDCDMSTCNEVAPVCSHFEDLVRYSVDQCCSTYECTCNPSKCFTLGLAPCPQGMERKIVDSDACCAIGKCTYVTSSSAFAAAGAGASPYLGMLGFGDDSDSMDNLYGLGARGQPYAGVETHSEGGSSLEIITEACICNDDKGRQWSYGDTWQQDCQICTCADVDTITCVEQECPEVPIIEPGFKLVQESSDKCCEVYRSVPETCEVENDCDSTYPTCSYCEDVIQYPIDDCCVTFECKCNPAKCMQMGTPPCPMGSARVIVEPDACCAVGKCVPLQKGGSSAVASSSMGMPTTTIIVDDNLYQPLSSGPGVDQTPYLDTPEIIPGSPSSFAPEIYPANGVCVAADGAERCYGESWVENDKACKVCICYEEGVVRCSLESCQEYPENKPGYKIIEEQATECCFSYRLVPEECQMEECEYTPNTCNYCEELISYPLDECCSTYECKCNKDKCLPTGKAVCPFGFIPTVIEVDQCCPVAKCVRNEKSTKSTSGFGVGSGAAAGDAQIIYGDATGYDKGYPQGVLSSSGKPQAGGAAGAESPFDTYGDFVGGDYGNKDFAPAYIVGGGDAAGDGYAGADGSGYGDGMFFGQPTPMSWPGADSKTGADAGSGAAAGQPQIIYGDATGYDKGYPQGVLSSSGKPQAGGAAGAESTVDYAISGSESPFCIDESGTSRGFGETWYQSGDSCTLCSCHSYGETKCEAKQCDEYPVAPNGFKVVSLQSDDCCLTYNIVPLDCEMDVCPNSPPVCEFYEDLQVIPDSDCCSSYSCACNPAKCVMFNDLVCQFGYVKSYVETVGCCTVPKCVEKQISTGSAAASSSSWQPSLFLTPNSGSSPSSKPSLRKPVVDSDEPLFTPIDGYQQQPPASYDDKDDSLPSLVPTSDIIPASSQSYETYVAERHNDLTMLFNEVLLSTSKTTCDFVTDSSACPTSCPDTMVCDGSSCVYPKDCPCVSNSVRRPTGAVWKENNGCDDCICIGGKVQCVPKSCDILTCSPGEKLMKLDDECCGQCVPDDESCTDTAGKLHSLWDNWVSGCDTCTCTTTGVVCEPEACEEITAPECASGEMLVTRKQGCCDAYECMCDVSQCTNDVPTCEAYHSAVITNPGDCCPQYDCVCRSEMCPSVPSCGLNERRERTNADTECCGTYECRPIGCTDESGMFRELETTWQMKNDTCQQCSCLSDQTIMCKSRDCPTLVKPTCADGNEPSLIFDIDGCCPSYVCSFVCRGYAGSSSINTFDGESFTRFCPCSHTLVKDTFGLDFEVAVQRKTCDGGICTGSLSITDSVLKQTASIGKDSTDMSGTSAFDISQLDNTITVMQKSTNVKIMFDRVFDTWSIEIPAKYAGQTEGLCGMADGDKSNDFWVGDYPAELDDFFKYWSTDPSCSEIQVEASSEARALCTNLFQKSSFAAMASVVDVSEYIDTCANFAIPQGDAIPADWPGCSVFAAFAETASRLGKCVEWRSDDFCSYGQCSVVGASYSACGPNTIKTCDNYQSYQGLNINYGSEGCFCNSGKVLLDGACVDVSSCPICTDENGVGRSTGDQWQYSSDACIIASCLPDGSISQNQLQCSPAPTCAAGETLAKVSDDTVCCAVYTCLPSDQETTCADVVCPTVAKPQCNIGEEWKVETSQPDGCCLTYSCECKSESCPSYPVPICEEGEELEVINAEGCCPSATCICKQDTCPQAPECSEEGYSLSVVKQSRCCSTYECVCDRYSCPSNQAPICQGGEVAVIDSTSTCCPTYKCVCDSSRCPPQLYGKLCSSGYKQVLTSQPDDCCESYECQCDVTQCPTVPETTCPDKPGYKILETGKEKRVGLPDCCPGEFEKVCVCDVQSCPVDNTVCESWERKYQTNVGDCCPQYACECDQKMCDSGVLICPINQHIVEKEINECCSTRVCECNVCPDPQPCQEGWTEIEGIADDCGCKTIECQPPSMCIVNGEERAPGATWMEDICTECTCESKMSGYSEVCTAIKCGTCSPGYTYVPVAGQCCGDCVPTVCHFDGKQYAPGQTWTSPDNKCTSCECMIDPINNEVYSQCNAPTCPPTDENCAPEDVITTPDGCCTYCAPKSSPQECRPIVDFVETFEQDGCTSQEKINVTMCEGQCTSASVFSIESGSFVKQCSCCSAVETEEKTIDLVCPGGGTLAYTYKVATKCECGATTCGVGLP